MMFLRHLINIIYRHQVGRGAMIWTIVPAMQQGLPIGLPMGYASALQEAAPYFPPANQVLLLTGRLARRQP